MIGSKTVLMFWISQLRAYCLALLLNIRSVTNWIVRWRIKNGKIVLVEELTTNIVQPLCIDCKLVWFSWLKPTDLLHVSPGGEQGRPRDWGRVQAKIRNAWSWTIVGNVFWECHALCTLKTSFVDFKTEEGHSSRYNGQTLHTFSMTYKSSWPIYYLSYILLDLFSSSMKAEIMLAGR